MVGVITVVDVRDIGDEADHRDVGGNGADLRILLVRQDDGQHPRAVLARALGDQLLRPVGESRDPGTVVDEDELVAQGLGAGHRRAESKGGVGLVVFGQQVGYGLGLVQQLLDVDAGQAAGHEAEGGQRRVAPADVGVGVDDAISRRAGLLVQRAPGVRDDHDALGGVDAGVGERALVGTTLGVGLDRGAGLAGDHDDRTLEPVAQRCPHRVGVRGVQHGELDAGRCADDFGGQRGPAHTAENDVVEALLSQVVAQSCHLADQRSRRPPEVDPGEPEGSLGLSFSPPQSRVLGEEPAGEALRHQARDVPGNGVRGWPRCKHAQCDLGHLTALLSSV